MKTNHSTLFKIRDSHFEQMAILVGVIIGLCIAYAITLLTLLPVIEKDTSQPTIQQQVDKEERLHAPHPLTLPMASL